MSSFGTNKENWSGRGVLQIQKKPYVPLADIVKKSEMPITGSGFGGPCFQWDLLTHQWYAWLAIAITPMCTYYHFGSAPLIYPTSMHVPIECCHFLLAFMLLAPCQLESNNFNHILIITHYSRSLSHPGLEHLNVILCHGYLDTHRDQKLSFLHLLTDLFSRMFRIPTHQNMHAYLASILTLSTCMPTDSKNYLTEWRSFVMLCHE